MKKLFVTIAISAACVGAFAQGKVLMGNDINHLVVMGSAAYLKPADVASAGLVAPWSTGTLPSTTALVAGLYAGTTAGSLSLVTTIPITGSLGNGRIQNVNYILPAGFPGGVLAYFQVKVWEAPYASYEAVQSASALNPLLIAYGASTPVFSGTPGSSVAYPPLVGGSFSWLQGAGAWETSFQSFNAVPEPSSMVLAGLGAASLLMFRRRK